MPRHLSFDARGTGAHTILLLHGFLGSGRNLASLARRWADRDPRVRLVLPDLTGHGSSPPLPAEPRLRDVAEDVLALATQLVGDAPVSMVGHSFGGRAALAARLIAPERVGDVVLLDISPGPLAGNVGQLDRLLELVMQAPESSSERDEMRRFFLERGVSVPLTEWLMLNLEQRDGVYRWRVDRDALAALNRSSRPEDLWRAIEGATRRTHCVRGAASPFVSDADAARMERAGCDVHTLEGAGHFVHVDAQAALLELLLAMEP